MTKLHSGSPVRSDRWSVGEIVDLPIALEEERFAPNREQKLQEFRQVIERDLGDLRHANEPAVLHAWLARWRNLTGDNTPGIRIEDSIKYAGRIATVTGFLLGLAAASDKLFFTGPEPLNVFALLGVFVLLPLVISALAFLMLSWRPENFGGVMQIGFLWLARKLTRWKHQAANDPAAALRADDSWSQVLRSLGRSSRILQLPVLAISQKFALFFGLGLFVMLQVRVSFWELAFGWQTTLTAPGHVWQAAVQIIAAPWTWFWPDGCPTLEQVNATRYSRMDGAAPIDPAASRAWWPFLAASILVWSVLLRTLILLTFSFLQRKRLKAFDPHTPDAHLFLRRLIPSWSTSAPISGEVVAPTPPEQARFTRTVNGNWLALVPDESDAITPTSKEVEQLLGVTIQKEVPFQFDDSLSAVTTAACREVRSGSASVAVMLPATRDPIDEVCDTLKAVEQSASGKTCVLILRGERSRLGLWKQKLASWHIDLPVEYVSQP